MGYQEAGSCASDLLLQMSGLRVIGRQMLWADDHRGERIGETQNVAESDECWSKGRRIDDSAVDEHIAELKALASAVVF
ncbi:hypothetical protein D5S17_09495 [Pseudonocardiaceae bacterium YIM PH 21723]|nr:hypothetical protein D5S17_09495 [Pseudonocardiaceae bacterium YIM PH 21723]